MLYYIDLVQPVHHYMSTIRLLRRGSRTVTIFLASLCALLLVSSYAVLPQFATVEYDAQVYRVDSVQVQHSVLQNKVDTLQKQRLELLDPINLPEYRTQIDAVQDATMLFDFLEFEQKARRTFTLGGAQLVRTNHYSSSSGDGLQVKITGVVHNAEDRSFSVLSSFISALKDYEHVTAIEHGSFTKRTTSEGKVEAPFTLTVTLHNA